MMTYLEPHAILRAYLYKFIFISLSRPPVSPFTFFLTIQSSNSRYHYNFRYADESTTRKKGDPTPSHCPCTKLFKHVL